MGFSGGDGGSSTPQIPFLVTSFNPANPLGTVSLTPGVMCGLGIYYTPSTTGNILVTLTAIGATKATIINFFNQLYYGTGTAPINGAVITGTAFSYLSERHGGIGAGELNGLVVFMENLKGLILNTQYWFDLSQYTAASADETLLTSIRVNILEY